jgi:hypothetical protein
MPQLHEDSDFIFHKNSASLYLHHEQSVSEYIATTADGMWNQTWNKGLLFYFFQLFRHSPQKYSMQHEAENKKVKPINDHNSDDSVYI